MNITIQGSKNFNVSNKIRDYINKKINKLNYFKSHINDINFYLDAEKHIYKVKSVLSFKKFGQYKFETSAEEIYTAIDKIIHIMDTKIQREKSKIQNHNNPGHQEIAEMFTDQESNEPEPTKTEELFAKPSTLNDAVMQMKLSNKELFGFNYINEKDKVHPAFIRKLDADVYCLFKYEENENIYSEYMLDISGKDIKTDKKIRDIKLKKMNLLNAQKYVYEDEFHYNIFLNNEDKINFLHKEDNGKWELILT